MSHANLIQRVHLQKYVFPALAVLLVMVWLGGGVTADATATDEWLELLALPVIGLAAIALLMQPEMDRLSRYGIALALLLLLVPAMQLLPLPASWWGLAAGREALAADLSVAHVDGQALRWTLSPSATEQGLWAMLPAMAGFLAALALDATQRRRVLQVLVALVFFNVLFAFFQAGLPRGSDLRLYPSASGGFGGLLANTNHQATACIIAMALSVGLSAHARLRANRGISRKEMPWVYAGISLLFLMCVPLTTSRAGMALALPILVLALVLTGTLSWHRLRTDKRFLVGALAALLLSIVGVQAAMGWMAIDRAEELRHGIGVATVGMAEGQFPLGSGIGTFVQVFEQAAPAHLQLASYVNHAHNEFAQWWLVGGLLGVVLLACAVVLLAVVAWRLLKIRGRGSNAILAGACLASVCAVLAHSWVDYPLRTLTLMCTTATLAGVMLGALGDAGRGVDRRRGEGLVAGESA